MDRRLWQIGVLGSECLDRHSSHRAWIGVLLAVLGSAFFLSCLDRSSSWRYGPYLDRNFRKFGIERSENVGIERSFREDSRIESREWRERV